MSGASEELPGDTLALALAFYRAPIQYQEWLRAREELPRGMEVILRLAGGNFRLPDELYQGLATTAEELREAAVFFVEQVFFAPDTDQYRVLGLNRDATAERIKEHHRLLMHLFHPDREGSREAWTDIYATRVNQAYNALRKPEARRAYDATLARGRQADAPGRQTLSPTAIIQRRVPTGTDRRRYRARLSPRLIRYLPALIMAGVVVLAVAFVGGVYYLNRPAKAVGVTTARPAETGAGQGAARSASIPPPSPAQAEEVLSLAPPPRKEEARHTSPPVRPGPATEDLPGVQAYAGQGQASAPSASRSPCGSSGDCSASPLQGDEPKATAAAESGRVAVTERPQLAVPVDVVGVRDQREERPVETQTLKAQRSDRVDPPSQRVIAAAQAADTTKAPISAQPSQGVDTTAQATEAAKVARAAEPPKSTVAVARTNEGQEGLDTAPAQASPSMPSAERALTQAELEGLIAYFIHAYEQGDLDAFVALFHEAARTNDEDGRTAIREDYAELFGGTVSRRMVVREVRWDLAGESARGVGRFWVDVLRSGDRRFSRYQGGIRFEIRKQDGRALITGLYHSVERSE